MSYIVNYKSIFFGMAAVFVFAASGLIVIELANLSRSELHILSKLPDFTLTERSGESFGTAQMRDEINIVNFFFTSCQGPCPYMASKMANLYQQYVTTDKVRFVSISVDPANDSLEALRAYANKYGVRDARWVFLRGEIEEVQTLTRQGFMLAGDLPQLHSTKFVLLDANGQIRGYYDAYDAGSLQLLTIHVRELLREMS